MDKLRAEFEAWWEESQSNLHHSNNGPFQCMAWKAWQASRAALVVDIDWPEANDNYCMEGEDGAYAMGHEDGKDKTYFAVIKGLNEAGISVKEAE